MMATPISNGSGWASPRWRTTSTALPIVSSRSEEMLVSVGSCDTIMVTATPAR